MATAFAVETEIEVKSNLQPELETRHIPRYHIILMDDDDHTYEYVIDMLRKLFGLTLEGAFTVAHAVDTQGQMVIETTTRERAEFKQEQIHAFGRDWRLPRCQGSMTCVIEPAL